MAAPTLPSPNDRRRRRRLRLIPIIGYTVVAVGLAYFLGARMSTTVIFVRHADTDAAMAGPDDDPPLSGRGRQRAELLADFLENVDVTGSVNAIYASDKRRTQETAAPLAKRLNLPVEIADHLDPEGFMDRVRREHAGKIVLVVSHSNTIQPLIDELHGSKNLKPFAPDEFNRLYIVTIPRPLGKVKTLEFFYEEPPVIAAPSVETPHAEPTTSANGGE
ncbi:MAG TPA: phosphoglycerate mutase family protein [Gammaproteobacteria bacterium]|nr:phosphoglycerate mutase family protein [Gammaproteobacteria bacterium]